MSSKFAVAQDRTIQHFNENGETKKMETQSAFWNVFMNKYQVRNLALEERRCKLQHRFDGMSCSMPPALLYRMFQKPPNQTNTLGLPSCDTRLKGAFKFEVMNEHLIKNNKKVAEKLKDVKLEFKHCMQRVEIPLAKQIEDRRRKSEQLQNNLRLISSILANKENCYIQDMNTLHSQLNCTCKSINDAKDTNKQLNQELCMLHCKYRDIQVDMVRQKMSEARTVERLGEALCLKQAMGDHKEIGRTQNYEEYKRDSLAELARRLSRTLLEIERCNRCKQLPEDLKETVRGIKRLLDLVHNQVRKRKTQLSMTTKVSLSPSPSEGEHQLKHKLTTTRSTTTNIRSKVDVSIQSVRDTIQIDVETETKISVSSLAHSLSVSRLSQKPSQVSIQSLCVESEVSIEKEEIAQELIKESSEEQVDQELIKEASEADSTEDFIRESSEEVAQELIKEASEADLTEDFIRESSEEIQSTDIGIKLSIEELAVSEASTLKEQDEEVFISESVSLLLSKTSRSTEKLDRSSVIKYSSSPALIYKKLSIGRPVTRPYSALAALELHAKPRETALKKKPSDLQQEIEMEAELYDKVSGDINVITTITESGNFEVITESPEGVIESIITRTESGNIDITTEVIKYADEDFERFASESELETSASSTSYVTISSSQLLAEKSLAFELPSTDKFKDVVSEETAYPETPSVSRFSPSRESSFEIESKISTEVTKTGKTEEEEEENEEEKEREGEVVIEDEETKTLSFQIETEGEVEEVSTTTEMFLAEGEVAVDDKTEDGVEKDEPLEDDKFTTEESDGHIESETETEVIEESKSQHDIEISIEEISKTLMEESEPEEVQSATECEAPVSEITAFAEKEEDTMFQTVAEEIETAPLLEKVYSSYAVDLVKSSPLLIEAAEETLKTPLTEAVETEKLCADIEKAEEDQAEEEVEVEEKESIGEAATLEEKPTIKSIEELQITIEVSPQEERELMERKTSEIEHESFTEILPLQQSDKMLEIQVEFPMIAENLQEESSSVGDQILKETKTKTVKIRHVSIDEEPFVVPDTAAENFQKDIEEALIKANLLVMDALREANRTVTTALEKTTKEVESALSLAAKKPTSKANVQVATEDDFLKHPSILESVPRGAESKMVPLTLSVTRQLGDEYSTEQEILEAGKKEEKDAEVVLQKEETLKDEYGKQPKEERKLEEETVREDQIRVLDEDETSRLGEDAQWLLERSLSLGARFWGCMVRGTEQADIPRVPVFTTKASRSAQFACNDVCGRLSRKKQKSRRRDSSGESGSYSSGEDSISDEEISRRGTEDATAFIDKAKWQEFAEENKEVEEALSSEAADGAVDVEIIMQNNISFPPLSADSLTEAEAEVSHKTEEEYEGTTTQEEDSTLIFEKTTNETERILPATLEQITPTVQDANEAEEGIIAEPSEEQRSKPESVSTEILSPKKSQESRKSQEPRKPRASKDSRRSRESRRSTKRKESKDVWQPLPLEEVKCEDVCRQFVASDQASARKRSKSSSDRKTERRDSRRSSRRSTLKSGDGKPGHLDAAETKEGKSKSLQQVPRSSLSKLFESEEARKADHKAVFKSKREEVKCDCKECECEICSIEKMKEKAKKLKASKLGKTDGCTCFPDCNCAVCSSSLSNFKKRGEEIKQSGDAKEILNKLPYTVQEGQQEHPLDCKCLCNSSKIEHWHPEQCDCLFCRCCTCSSDLNRRAKNKFPIGECLYEQLCIKGKSSFPIDNPVTSIISGVISDSQTPLPDFANKKLSIVQIPDSSTDTNLVSSSQTHLTESSSKKLSIVQLTYPFTDSQRSKNLTSDVEYISLMNVSSTHPADCDCFDCLCATCSVSTKTPSSKKNKQVVHHDNCSCPECLEKTLLVLRKEKQRNLKTMGALEADFEEQKQTIAKLHEAVKQLGCACQTPKVKATDSTTLEMSFVALQKSTFHVTMSGLKLALANLESKCKQKDQMIAALTDDLKLRANSNVLDGVLHKLATTNDDQIPTDFDRIEICNLLPRPVSDSQSIKPNNQLEKPLECQPCSLQDYANSLTGLEERNGKKEPQKRVKDTIVKHPPVCLHSDQASYTCKTDKVSLLQANVEKSGKHTKALHSTCCSHKTKSRQSKNNKVQAQLPNEKICSCSKKSKIEETSKTRPLAPMSYKYTSEHSRAKHSKPTPGEEKPVLVKAEPAIKLPCPKHGTGVSFHSEKYKQKESKTIQDHKDRTLKGAKEQLPLTKSKAPPEEHKRSTNKHIQQQMKDETSCRCTKHPHQRPYSVEGRHQPHPAKKKTACRKNGGCLKRTETQSFDEPKKPPGKTVSCSKHGTTFVCIQNSSREHEELSSEKIRRKIKMQTSLGATPINSKAYF